MEILRRSPWSRIRGQNSVHKEFLEIVSNGKPTGNVWKEMICSFRHDMNKRGKSSPSNPSQTSFMQKNERKSSRTRSPRGKSPSGGMSRWLCKDYLKGICTNSFCEKWHPPECCRFGEKWSYAHRQVDEQPTTWSKSNYDKSTVALLKKGDWQERELVTDECHDRPGKPGKRSENKLGQIHLNVNHLMHGNWVVCFKT